MSTDNPTPTAPNGGEDEPARAIAARLIDLPIENELKDSYLTYAMSVIVSRALPDVRDGLKPSQRRILVAMNDLGLTAGASTSKCAGIVGETMKRYHPHGDAAIYPTLVRMAQEWVSRYVLVDKQGNYGSIAGLPPAQMRYTEARLSPFSMLMLEDLKLDTVDFLPTYDEKLTEPSVLPSKLPNLLVNGSSGIAVGMATSIPPHNLGEICSAVIAVIDRPHITIEELMQIVPGPDFPTGGIVGGRNSIWRGYATGRSTVTVRARTEIEDDGKRKRIIIKEIPYQQTRDNVESKIAAAISDGRVPGASAVHVEADLEEPARLAIDVKRDADPDVVLNQLYKFTPLQDSFSVILLALVDGKPRVLSLKEMLSEFIRHRVNVIRRRTQFLLRRARNRKHTVQGLLLAHANIDEVIRVIRSSKTQIEAKERLMQIKTPAAMLRRALGDEGFEQFQRERGIADQYTLTPVQADAILKMTLGQLVNLEQEKLADEHQKLMESITEYLGILGTEERIYGIIRQDMEELIKKHGDKRRTDISDQEATEVDIEDLIEEETMVVTITKGGYIKRTPSSVYKAQRRGGKGLKGATVADDDPIEHLFVTSTHDYLLFFTNKGKCYWQKVYNLPQLSRESKGRAIVNLLQFAEGEYIADCRAVRDLQKEDHFLMMATRRGLIKKTPLMEYSRPKQSGIIAIKLKDDDEVVDCSVTQPGDEVVLSTKLGMAIRFKESDARPMGRNTSGVKGISLSKGDEVVGMVVAVVDATLLTACQKGYGKRTFFGPGSDADDEGEDETSSNQRYRTQRRGGKGLRDIKTTERNGPVVSIAPVNDDDELIMMSAGGKLQRIRAADVGIVGRNTQGVRIMKLEEDDTLAAIVRVPREDDAVGDDDL